MAQKFEVIGFAANNSAFMTDLIRKKAQEESRRIAHAALQRRQYKRWLANMRDS